MLIISSAEKLFSDRFDFDLAFSLCQFIRLFLNTWCIQYASLLYIYIPHWRVTGEKRERHHDRVMWSAYVTTINEYSIILIFQVCIISIVPWAKHQWCPHQRNTLLSLKAFFIEHDCKHLELHDYVDSLWRKRLCSRKSWHN